MTFGSRRVGMPVLFLAATIVAGCSHATAPPVMAAGSGIVTAGSAATIASADSTARLFTPADVDFMTGMVPHHAQAVIMARWCPSHGARADVKLFCEKIVIAQTDEIRLMRHWLADRGQPVPDSMSTKHLMKMAGMTHEMLMPGMLSDSQMVALDRARGSEFDRLFLVGMIGHHQGAIDMVQELFRQPRGGQEDVVFRFATDVLADQSAEIERMKIMLETVP